MKLSLCYSLILHASVILLIFLSDLSFKSNNIDYALVITDVVPISDITNVRVAQNNKLNESKSDQSQPVNSQEVKKVEEKPVKPQEPTQTQPKEIIPQKEFEKIPDKKAQDLPKVTDTKHTPKKNNVSTKPDKNDDFTKNILKSLQDSVKKSDDIKKINKDFNNLENALKGETNKDFNSNLPMTLSEIDGIKSQIIRRWNTASFGGSAEKAMQVIIRIKLDGNGNVLDAKPQFEVNSSVYYKPFVESALRAVNSASPITNLSKDKYNTWKEIELRFDSSGMIY